MLGITLNSLEVRLVVAPSDMRKLFDGLSGLAMMLEREDSYQRYLWLFTNKRQNRVKLLYFDRSGAWVSTNEHTSQTHALGMPMQEKTEIYQASRL